ncbi:hypothetical protein GCAAIG_07960 [Candidatus Electronema halotolerans]
MNIQECLVSFFIMLNLKHVYRQLSLNYSLSKRFLHNGRAKKHPARVFWPGVRRESEARRAVFLIQQELEDRNK